MLYLYDIQIIQLHDCLNYMQIISDNPLTWNLLTSQPDTHHVFLLYVFWMVASSHFKKISPIDYSDHLKHREIYLADHLLKIIIGWLQI